MGWDVVIVGGGHNGLVAASYLTKAGKSVLLLEKSTHLGGAAVSARVFDGVDVRLSRYSYLVSLLPRSIVNELGLSVKLLRRNVSSYTPVGADGLLVDSVDTAGTAECFRRVTGGESDYANWQRFYARTGRVAERVFPTLTAPLPSKAELRALVDDGETWQDFFERPLGETIERYFTDDLVRGVALTDALIGTFSRAHADSLAQNRCFLYHVIGNGTGDWDVPEGGMGAVTRALIDAAAGASLRTGCEVTALTPDGEVSYRDAEGEHTVGTERILVNAAPAVLQRLLGEQPGAEVEGAQLKINMIVRRLPRLRDTRVDPAKAFAGTFHVNESYAQLERAYSQAAQGKIPDPAPCEIYCHTLTDPSIIGERAAGLHTLTLFGLHMPTRLFTVDGAKERAVAATIASLNSVLAEPIEDCLAVDGNGNPCLEARTPLELEADVGLPGGNIFHRELSWPFGESGRWGVETEHDKILLCGAGAKRGGGVSGIPGHNAAMAVLGR